MFRWLAQKLDRTSGRVLIGTTIKTRARHIWKANPDLTYEQVEKLATAEGLISMRSEAIDVESYSALKDWSERFLTSPLNDRSKYLKVITETEDTEP